MLTESQTKQVKRKILEQIELWQIDEKDKELARKQIESMNNEQLELFLAQNKLVVRKKSNGNERKEENNQGKEGKKANEKQECVFCLISEGKIPSYKIDENKNNLAVLEINPLSKGHVLIVPRKHLIIEKIPSNTLSLAKKISKKIKSKLKAKDIEISTSSMFGHAIVNVIPIYDEKPSERKKASQEELQELAKKLEKKQREKKAKKIDSKTETKEKIDKLPEAPRRIP